MFLLSVHHATSRHSLSCNLLAMKLEALVSNISCKHCKTTKYIRVFFVIGRIFHYLGDLQTLTTLDLSQNSVDEEGAKHIANMLEVNKVSCFFLVSLLLLIYRHSEYWTYHGVKLKIKQRFHFATVFETT